MEFCFVLFFQATNRMARAETVESVGEAAGGVSGPLPHQYPSTFHFFLHNNFPGNHHRQNQQQNHQEQPILPTPPPSPPDQPNAFLGEQSGRIVNLCGKYAQKGQKIAVIKH